MVEAIVVYEVAAFADRADAGSPTGVVLEADGLTDAQMLHIARSLNFSHTAFFMQTDQPECDVNVRFLTSAGELKNCAHATIAAHYLRAVTLKLLEDTLVRQKTLSGIQNVNIRVIDGTISVHFKQREVTFNDVSQDVLSDLTGILGISSREALDERFPVVLASPGANRFLVGLKHTEHLWALEPDFEALKQLCLQVEAIGCFVFSVSDFGEISHAEGRMFAPAIAVDEDIINGNSSGCLVAYLLHQSDGQQMTLAVNQGKAFDRPGTVLVNAERVGDVIETTVGGTSVVVRRHEVELM